MADDLRPPPRVATAQAQARRSLGAAVAFGLAAAVAAIAPHESGAWLPLHLFLAGGVTLAISGATQLFTVTWSAGTPGPGVLVAGQRALVAVGAAGLALGRELDGPTWATATAGLGVTTGLVLLGVLLVTEVRGAKVDRFAAAVRCYLVAVGFGVAGTALGAAMVTGDAAVRDAHLAVNLLGFVGITIAGTLPSFVATSARMRMSKRLSPRRLDGVLLVLAASTALAAAGVRVALVGYVAGLVYLATLLPRPASKQLRWAGARLVGLGLGFAWWIGSVIAAVARDDLFPERAVVALVIGGFAQVVVASLAYLGPVLRGGGHEVLAAGFATSRSWLAIVAVNVAAVGAATGTDVVAAGGVAILAADVAARVMLLLSHRDVT